MKNLIQFLLIVSLGLIANISMAEDKSLLSTSNKPPVCEPQKSDQQFARRGCCSHHGGVCGCSGGRAACCDGSLSPSCGCNSDSIRDDLNPTKNQG